MDPGLSVETRQALLKAKEQDSRLFVSYYKFLTNLLHGDLGVSQSLGRPVRELLSDRLPVTMLTIVKSVTLGWLLGFGLARYLEEGKRFDFGSWVVIAVLALAVVQMLAVLMLPSQEVLK